MISLALISRDVLKEKIGTVLHLLAIHIENFRAESAETMSSLLNEHQLCVPLSGVVVVTADRGDLKTLRDQIANPGKHLHMFKLEFCRGMSTVQIRKGVKKLWAS